MGYVYSNPYADAANALSGGANTLGETVLKMAMLRQQGQQRQQDMMMQMAQMQQTGQYRQQQMGMEQQGLDLRKQEFGTRQKLLEAEIPEHEARAKESKQRLDQAMQFQNARSTLAKFLPMLGRMQPQNGVTSQPPFAPAQPEQPMLDQGGLQQLLSAIAQTSKSPEDSIRNTALIQALQGGAMQNPQELLRIGTGQNQPRPMLDPQQAIAQRAIAQAISQGGVKDLLPPTDIANNVYQGLGMTNRVGQTQGDQQPQPIFAVNPQTKQRIMSTDGGVTWKPAQ